MKSFFFTALFVAMVGQTPEVKAPALTEIQKLQIQNAAQKLEIAQLRFKAAQEELMGLLSKVSVPGYELDLATLTYRKKEPKEPKK